MYRHPTQTVLVMERLLEELLKAMPNNYADAGNIQIGRFLTCGR